MGKNTFSFLTRLADGRLIKMLLKPHLTENALALEHFLKGTQRLIDVVSTDTNLHGASATLKFEYATLFKPISHVVAG